MTEEAAPDINLLFAKDPLQHTDKDLDHIIAEMRKARATFLSSGKAPDLVKPGKPNLAKTLGIDVQL